MFLIPPPARRHSEPSTEKPHDTQPQASNNPTRVKKACNRCRVKKIKCDLRLPCSHCRQGGIECRLNDQDPPDRGSVTSAYIAALEAQLASLKADLSEINLDPTRPSEPVQTLSGQNLSMESRQAWVNMSSTSSEQPKTIERIAKRRRRASDTSAEHAWDHNALIAALEHSYQDRRPGLAPDQFTRLPDFPDNLTTLPPDFYYPDIRLLPCGSTHGWFSNDATILAESANALLDLGLQSSTELASETWPLPWGSDRQWEELFGA